MNWALFNTVFVAIFIAEMGDKTQLAALALSADHKSTWTVLAAVLAGLCLAGTLGVLMGRVIGEVLNPTILRFFSGILFLTLGVWTLWKG